jgi:hypothetical protein
MGYFWTAHMGALMDNFRKNLQRYKFYTFTISFKKKYYMTADPMSVSRLFS